MFLFRLALHLGWSFEELLDRMSSAEITMWKAYANHEPFGYPMDNFRMGVPAAEIMNTINGTVNWKRKPRSRKASDLYPQQAKPPPALTAEQRDHIRRKHGKRRNGNR